MTGPNRPAPRVDQLPSRIDAPTQIVGVPEKPDPSRRNVIVLDDFRTNDNPVRGTSARSHGEAISRPLETQGYNLYRVQDADLDPQGKNSSGRNSLDHLAERIRNGQIPARPGDVVNLSFGQDEKLAFGDVNRMAGYRGDQSLTRSNLTLERAQQLRERLQQRLDDPNSGLTQADRDRVKDILANAAGIDKLKELGLVVINAAGNEGPDALHPGYLNSTHSLQNRNGDGSFDPTSARHRLTEPARGSFVSRTLPGGVDVNNDGIPDFDSRPRKGDEDLSGTSFSVLEFLRRKYPPPLH